MCGLLAFGIEVESRRVSYRFAAVAAVLLGVAVAAAFVPVHLHLGDAGDGPKPRCVPVFREDITSTSDCAMPVRDRLTLATAAAVAAGMCGLLAFGVEVEQREEFEQHRDAPGAPM
jgi:hypothetical protein